jgi:hypothetical protein
MYRLNPAESIFVWGVVLGLGGWGMVAGYRSVDRAGMVPHDADASISAAPDWFVGQTKACQSQPVTDGPSRGYALSSLKCDDGPLRQIRIRFWGRRSQAEYGAVAWNCQREETRFVCSEISGMSRPDPRPPLHFDLPAEYKKQ